MKKFYLEYKDDELVQRCVAQLPWRHNIALMSKIKDKLSVDWVLEGINNPIGISSFELKKYIPKDILEKLPTEEELNLHIDKNE